MSPRTGRPPQDETKTRIHASITPAQMSALEQAAAKGYAGNVSYLMREILAAWMARVARKEGK